ncbi:MAG: NAD(P)H-hydrate dehydratase [Gammaproteobacteria bacterium]|nr:NAD(P)H-hydrate dehydratase [Gammaproteobacteria bacterium]
MTKLPNNLYTAEQTRELDRITIEEFEVSGTVLMERAGTAAFDTLKEHWPDAKSICIVCGTGNNGGDGFVVARLAHEQGLNVEVLVVDDMQKIKGDALAAKQRLEGGGVTPKLYGNGKLPLADLVVDAVFGTGLNGAVTGDAKYAITAINQHGTPVLALDIPSGLLADTGNVEGDVVHADVTISFIGLNQGLLTAKGPDCCGELVFTDLQIPAAAKAKVPTSIKRLNISEPVFKKRDKDSHKGLFGHVLVIGGDVGMSGAARLACEAALRSGTGLVSLATRYAHASIINSSRPEIMSYPAERENEIEFLLEKADVLAVGPGLGKSEWSATLLAAALNSTKPLIIDADGLNLLAIEPYQRENWILTPHPGEAARLLDVSIKDIQENRFSAIKQLAEKFGGTVVLKGNGSLIYSEGMTYLCDEGNPGMATGGMGDVLTGIIASLVAQGFSMGEAAKVGVHLHAAAGDAAAKGAGERGLLASDLMPTIRRLVNQS